MPSMYGQSSFDDILNQYASQAPAGGIIPTPAAGNISSPWKSFMGYLNGPISGQSGDADSLMAYKPVSRLAGIGSILTGAAQGVLSARGPYRNPLGAGLLGAGQGAEQARKEDEQRRQQAVQDQYKKMGAMLQMAQARAALAKAQAPVKYSPGEIGIDPVTNQQVAAGAPRTGEVNGYTVTYGPDGKPTPTGHFPGQPQSFEGAAVQGLTGGGGPQVYGQNGPQTVPGAPIPPDPKTMVGLMQRMAALKQPIMNTEYRQAQAESAYSTDMGHQAAKKYETYMTEGETAQKALDNNKLLRGLLSNIDTGPDQPIRMKLQAAASAVGIPDGAITNLSKGQALNAIAGKSVLDAAGGHFSQGFSNSDRDFAQSLAANASNFKEANKIILDASDAAHGRVRDLQGEATKWEVKNRDRGGLLATNEKGETFDMYAQRYAREHPLYTPQWMKEHGLDPNDPLGSMAAPQGGGGTPLDRY